MYDSCSSRVSLSLPLTSKNSLMSIESLLSMSITPRMTSMFSRYSPSPACLFSSSHPWAKREKKKKCGGKNKGHRQIRKNPRRENVQHVTTLRPEGKHCTPATRNQACVRDIAHQYTQYQACVVCVFVAYLFSGWHHPQDISFRCLDIDAFAEVTREGRREHTLARRPILGEITPIDHRCTSLDTSHNAVMNVGGKTKKRPLELLAADRAVSIRRVENKRNNMA